MRRRQQAAEGADKPQRFGNLKAMIEEQRAERGGNYLQYKHFGPNIWAICNLKKSQWVIQFESDEKANTPDHELTVEIDCEAGKLPPGLGVVKKGGRNVFVHEGERCFYVNIKGPMGLVNSLTGETLEEWAECKHTIRAWQWGDVADRIVNSKANVVCFYDAKEREMDNGKMTWSTSVLPCTLKSLDGLEKNLSEIF